MQGREHAFVALASGLWLLFYSAGAFGADGDCEGREATNYKTHIGEQYPATRAINPGEPNDLSVARPGKKYRHFRVRLHKYAPVAVDWRLTITDFATGQPWQHIGPDDFRCSDFLWSRRLPGDRAKAQLWAAGELTNFLQRTEYVAVPDDPIVPPYYSVQTRGEEQWQPLFCKPRSVDCQNVDWQLRRWGDAVGFVMLHYRQEAWSCSGFLIAKDLFITNWHCGGPRTLSTDDYWNDDVLRSMIIDFSWDGDENSNEYGFVDPIPADPILEGSGKILQNRDLDFAIFRVRPLGQTFGPPPFTRFNVSFDYESRDTRNVAIIHHPLGKIKQVTMQHCSIVDPSYPSWELGTQGIDFTHVCDTEGGSSGAPIFDSNGKVIGLHHRGFTANQHTHACDKKNKAVRADKLWQALPVALRREVGGSD